MDFLKVAVEDVPAFDSVKDKLNELSKGFKAGVTSQVGFDPTEFIRISLNEIVETLREKYSVVFLCKIMGVSKSGYYRWRGRKGKPNRYEQDRKLLTKLLEGQHKKHPSHGYHKLAIAVFNDTGLVFSHNLAHKCCKQAGIRSKARKYTSVKQEKNILVLQMKSRETEMQPIQLKSLYRI